MGITRTTKNRVYQPGKVMTTYQLKLHAMLQYYQLKDCFHMVAVLQKLIKESAL